MLTITLRPARRFSPARRAALLLLALLAHLLLMASPLHAEPLHDHGAAVAHAEHGAEPQHCPECAPALASSGHPNGAADCAVQSSAPPTSRGGRVFAGLAPPSWLQPPADRFPLPDPARTALQFSDPACSPAFLQVFRN